MKLPGPDHPITIARNGRRVRVIFAGKVTADTTRALTLNEAGYKPGHYIPREDADMSLLAPTAHASHCRRGPRSPGISPSIPAGWMGLNSSEANAAAAL